MRRREFMTLLGGAAAAWPMAARAQGSRLPVVGFLRDTGAEHYDFLVTGLRKGLGEAGFVDGQNAAIAFGWANGDQKRLATLAADYARQPVSVILASATYAALAAKAATSSIPIVFAVARDPVALGLVPSLSRPAGNLTGVSYLNAELGGKRLSLLREVVPGISNIAVLMNPSGANARSAVRDIEEAARGLGMRAFVLRAESPGEIEAAFATVRGKGAGAMVVINNTTLTGQRAQIVALAARYTVPTVYANPEYVSAGGLMSYGPDLTDVHRLAGNYVGQILKGAKPEDLPVQQPTRFTLFINIKTAKELGLTIPPGILAIVDEVIE